MGDKHKELFIDPVRERDLLQRLQRWIKNSTTTRRWGEVISAISRLDVKGDESYLYVTYILWEVPLIVVIFYIDLPSLYQRVDRCIPWWSSSIIKKLSNKLVHSLQVKSSCSMPFVCEKYKNMHHCISWNWLFIFKLIFCSWNANEEVVQLERHIQRPQKTVWGSVCH